MSEEPTIREIILENYGALNPPGFTRTKEWFLGLPEDLRPNEVYELAEAKGLPAYVCMGLKLLQAHRSTAEFLEIVLGEE